MTSIGVDVEGMAGVFEALDDLEDEWTGSGTMIVGTAVEYAIFIEMGTSKMDPKPFFRPALMEARRDIEGFIRDNTETTAEQIDSAEELVETVAFALERRIKEIITQKGLVDTGAMRASVAAVETRGQLRTLGDVAAFDEVDLDPEDFEEAAA